MNELIKEDYYPINWWIEEGDIIIQDKNGNVIDSDNIIYKSEIEFIQNEISEMTFYGEICFTGE